MNGRSNRLLGAVILFLSVATFQTDLGQEQSQLIKPCMAETTPKKNEETENATRKKGRKHQKTKYAKKDRNNQQQAKNSNCN